MLRQSLVKKIEDSIGVFDVAISYASDGDRFALLVNQFAAYYDLRCYDYQEFTRNQLGIFQVSSIMEYIYTRTNKIIIINTEGYRDSSSTEEEYNYMLNTNKQLSIYVFELGGDKIDLPNHKVEHFSKFANDALLSVLSS